ncbi:Wzt carbohydrate-binding domain-containing protein, partial [Hydrotalea sp.]|uniref:Wzt carbohydrate-binding domain-containing protein n=1 Tax=Hydrotalea sp. TaxID=2881279 RepID=UPI003D0B52C1
DAEFQKKCLGKMKDVSVNDGRTVLFVSHNMGAITGLCNELIVMQNGLLAYRGEIQQGINYYLQNNLDLIKISPEYINHSPRESDILSIQVHNKFGDITSYFNFHDEVKIQIQLQSLPIHENALISIRIKDQKDRNIFTTERNINTKSGGIKKFTVQIPGSILVPNTYFPLVALHIPNTEIISYLENSVSFVIEETGTDFFHYKGYDYGCVSINCKWE